MPWTRRAWVRLVSDEDTLLGEWPVSLGPRDQDHLDVTDAVDRRDHLDVTDAVDRRELMDAIQAEFRAFARDPEDS